MSRLWRVEVIAPASQAEAIEAAFEAGFADILQASSRMERGAAWVVQALCDAKPDAAQLKTLLAKFRGLTAAVTPLPERDWVAEGLKHLPPVQSGRVRVVGGHHPPPRTGAIELLIDAGPAFGTGQHATTRGCLLALDRLAQHKAPRRILDLGCGTAVLAMAAARLWRHRRPHILASDVDALSVVEARRNIARNRLGGAIEAITADGFRHPRLRQHAPYDLILANILALPLIRLAPTLRRNLAPGGVAVLSGLLEAQEPAVRNAYRAAGLILLGRIRLPGWPTLLLGRASPAESHRGD